MQIECALLAKKEAKIMNPQHHKDLAAMPGAPHLTASACLSVAVGLLLAIAPPVAAAPADHHRLHEVEMHGRQVMPFDLERTVHVFRDQKDGGLQQVVVRNSKDRKQIDLIRRHLREEAARFARGDFSDPAHIHGRDMPGLAELRAGAKRIAIRYAEIPAGASIRYTSRASRLIAAIHRWLAAQRRDHGPHARP